MAAHTCQNRIEVEYSFVFDAPITITCGTKWHGMPVLCDSCVSALLTAKTPESLSDIQNAERAKLDENRQAGFKAVTPRAKSWLDEMSE